ncbi:MULTISPECIES: hypothetical protein [Niastella]|uniref:DUF2116 family Zn-ribbon domain-containing protein n=1 Tax=Niastella soli TaxID=2821487 RepID=A0ABS3YWY8_9BACT|nr:hypothetical protein [Niastella soli]MBO9202258.1 hypothetical protein [Niastella soli]
MTVKNCLACDRPIKGRIDKKFCDDSCRNNYNNRLNSYSIPLVRNINNILRRNRRILEDLLAPLERKVLVVERQKLAELGFQFQYFTEQYHPDKKEQYFYCYEYGYRSIDQEKVLAVKDTRKRHFIHKHNQVITKRGE